jgi:chemotaxis methyl-accepting protein methylase
LPPFVAAQVILYILLTGIPPFAADSDEESFHLTKAGKYDKSHLEEVSDTCVNDHFDRI